MPNNDAPDELFVWDVLNVAADRIRESGFTLGGDPTLPEVLTPEQAADQSLVPGWMFSLARDVLYRVLKPGMNKATAAAAVREAALQMRNGGGGW